MKWVLSNGLSLSLAAFFALAGIVTGLGAYTFWYAQGGSYFSSDPRSCMNCHIMRDQFDSWQKSSHHHVAKCNDCHLPHAFVDKYLAKAENGFFHSKAFTLQDFPEPIRIKPRNAAILNANCIHCHKDLVGDLLHHGAFADATDQCVRCHAGVGHGSYK
jgi:cytochrome c nitrite reductase small subunit